MPGRGGGQAAPGRGRIAAADCRRDLPAYLTLRLLSEAAALVQSVAVGWTVYQWSHAPWALGMVGLLQFIPAALFMLPAGEICDRLQPRSVLVAGLALQGACAVGFMALTSAPLTRWWLFYSVLFLSGTARACSEPAGQALLPLLVSAQRLPRAIALNSSLWQAAAIAGPALGGLAYTLGPGSAYGSSCAGFVAAMLCAVTVTGRPAQPAPGPDLAGRMARMGEGLHFVRSHPVLLGALSLDLLAVLLGGATALLPIYARDLLHAGPLGLGLLRSAPAAGACVMALYQVRHPPARRAGPKLLTAVAVFGLSTLIFAFSTSLALSLAALLAVGASDMVSVNIRSSLVQLVTPEALRGRVAAVNLLFISTSSELGAFESGMAASLMGTVPAVAAGGIGALIAAVAWMRLFPELYRIDRLPVPDRAGY